MPTSLNEGRGKEKVVSVTWRICVASWMTWRVHHEQARGAVGVVACSWWLPLKWLAMGVVVGTWMVVVVEKEGEAALQQVVTTVTGAMMHHISSKYS